jgi:hypothetical protein
MTPEMAAEAFLEFFRQFAHFVGDDGEAAAMLAGTGGFDGGVEGEQVGLVGDGGDQADRAGDFLAMGVEFSDRVAGFLNLVDQAIHCPDHLGNGGAAFLRGAGVVGGQLGQFIGGGDDAEHVALAGAHVLQQVFGVQLAEAGQQVVAHFLVVIAHQDGQRLVALVDGLDGNTPCRPLLSICSAKRFSLGGQGFALLGETAFHLLEHGIDVLADGAQFVPALPIRECAGR